MEKYLLLRQILFEPLRILVGVVERGVVTNTIPLLNNGY